MLSPAIEYKRRRPEQTVLYQVVQRELRTLVQMCEEKNRPLPTFVVQEFEKFLRCGILAHGFARVRCCDCGHDRLVGFSCKRRGFCPSCYGKWMAEKSAHLVDRVFDQIPVRQWVLALPIPFRFLLAYNGSLQSAVLKCFIDSVSRYLRHKAKREYNLTSVKEAHPAFVTGIHRSDSSAKLNLHFHTLCPDGVFIEDYHKGPMSFAEVSPPTHKEIEAVAIETCHRTIRMLTKRGLWQACKNQQACRSRRVLPHDAPLSGVLSNTLCDEALASPPQCLLRSHSSTRPATPHSVRAYTWRFLRALVTFFKTIYPTQILPLHLSPQPLSKVDFCLALMREGKR